MRELIAITDLTDMGAGQVCVAGVTQEFECIRPVIHGGVRLGHLYRDGKPIIFPGAKVWMDFSPAEIVPPHVEDLTFDPQSIEYKDAFEGRHWEILLRKTSHPSVQSVFDGNLEDRRVAPGTLTRSLGTIGDVKVLNLDVDTRYDKVSLRLDFKDASGDTHHGFPVNDLALRGMYFLLAAQHEAPASALLKSLQEASRTYLRIGLARPATVGGYPEACWVQVTGVYTFPDYLGGRIWADFQ